MSGPGRFAPNRGEEPFVFRVVDIINLSSSAHALLRERVLAMRASGLDNRILCADGAYVPRLRADGIPVHPVHLPRGLDPLRLLWSTIEIAVYLWRNRVDLVHTHCSVPGVVGRVAAWLARVPVVVHTVHGFHFSEPRPHLGRGACLAVERACGRMTHALLTQSREDLELAERHGIGPARSRRRVGNGIDLARFRPRRAPMSPDGVTTLACVARFEPVKNHGMLLAAAARLKERGVRFRLLLVGEGPLRATHEAACERLGITDLVEFLGRRDDVPDVLAASDIAVLTSTKEGLPRAAIEAMACALPVVATRAPGTREVVRAGTTGFLVEPGDVAGLADALELLIDDPERRARMGAAGRAVALAEHDERTIVAALEDVYREQLRGRVPRALEGPAAAPAEPGTDEPAGAPAVVTVGRNFSFRLGSQIVAALVNVVGLVLLGRRLSADGYGTYVFYASLIPLLAAATDLGLGIVATREIARAPAALPTLLGDAIVLRLALSGLAWAGATAVAATFLDPAHTLLVGIVAAGALLDFGQDPSIWVFRARERLDLEGLVLLVSQVVWLALLAFAMPGGRLTALLAAAPVAYAVRAGVGWSILARHVPRPRIDLAPGRLRRLLAEGAPFGVALFVSVLYARVGVLLLKVFAAPADVACFNAAYLLSQPLGFVASALGLALLPVLARRAVAGGDAVRATLRPALRGPLLLGLPLAAGLVTLSDPIVGLLFHGRGFEPAGAALRITGACVPLVFLNLVSRYTLAALGRQRAYLEAVALGLIMNAGLGLLLVPRFGLLGACGAYVAAEATITLSCLMTAARYVSPRELARDASRPLLAAGAMALTIVLVRGAGAVVAGAAGLAAYAALLWLSRALSADDVSLLLRVTRSFGSGAAARRATPPLAGQAAGVEPARARARAEAP